jgi:hypothetical protein
MAEKSAVKDEAESDAAPDDEALALALELVPVFDELLHATIVRTAPIAMATAAERVRVTCMSFLPCASM